MIPTYLVPSPDTLQVPWGWLQLLLSTTFLLHLLTMNIMLGWAIIAFCNHAFKQSISAESQLISQKLPFVIAFAVNFGIAPLLFLQVLYGHLMYTSSVTHGRVLALYRHPPHSCLLCSLHLQPAIYQDVRPAYPGQRHYCPVAAGNHLFLRQ